jgi:Skp family chaperone for outer membrane proteins
MRLRDRKQAVGRPGHEENGTVKRKWMIAAGMLVLGAAIYVSSHLMAQPGAATTTPARPAAPQTRIALCNLSSVIKGYKKYQSFQAEIKGEIDKFQTKDKEIRKHIEDCMKAMQAPTCTPADKEKYEHWVQTDKHQLEDNQAEAKAVLGKKSDEQMVILYKEVRDMAQRYAASQGIELVLHYNDADEETQKAEFWSPANVARKMQAGACMPLHVAPGMDISAALIQMLNSQVPPAAAGH